MITVLSRHFKDDFTHDLFYKLLSGVNSKYNAYYFWPAPDATLGKTLRNNINLDSPNIVIGIKDHFEEHIEFNFWQDNCTAGTKLLNEFITSHKDKNFIIFTSLDNLDQEINLPNLQIINWGGDLTNEKNDIINLPLITDKNFNSDKTFLCLNRTPRYSRIITASYLINKDYIANGVLTFLGQNEIRSRGELLNYCPWVFDNHHQLIREQILSGYYKLQNDNSVLFDAVIPIPSGHSLDLYSNFKNLLYPLYKNSFVEIITETTCNTPSFMLTEKILFSIYACNFPIIIGGSGMVNHLRELGFDVFDDIINHSYDSIKNPIDRITNAIDLNERLLSDPDYAKQQWLKRKNRFIKNTEVAKNIYNWYEQRAVRQFNNLKWL